MTRRRAGDFRRSHADARDLPLPPPSAGDHPPEDLLQRWREGRLGSEQGGRPISIAASPVKRDSTPDTQLAAFAQQALPSPPPIPKYRYVLNDDDFPRCSATAARASCSWPGTRVLPGLPCVP